MALPINCVVEKSFIWNHKGAEMQVIVIKEEIYNGMVETGLCRGYLCPLHFEAWLQTVCRLYLTQALGYFPTFFQRTPNGPQYHRALPIIFKMAAFIAVNVIGLAHFFGLPLPYFAATFAVKFFSGTLPGSRAVRCSRSRV